MIPASSVQAQTIHDTHPEECQVVGTPYVSYREYHEVPGAASWAPTELCMISVYRVSCVKICKIGKETIRNSGHGHSLGATHSIRHD